MPHTHSHLQYTNGTEGIHIQTKWLEDVLSVRCHTVSHTVFQAKQQENEESWHKHEHWIVNQFDLMTNKTAGRTNMRNLNWTSLVMLCISVQTHTHTCRLTPCERIKHTWDYLKHPNAIDEMKHTWQPLGWLYEDPSDPADCWWRSLDPRVHITAGQRLTTAGLNHIINAHLSISTVTAQCNKAFNGSITHGIRKRWSVFSWAAEWRKIVLNCHFHEYEANTPSNLKHCNAKNIL